MDQLDDALIFHLATLPCNSFVVVQHIFNAYSKGQIKGQKVPRSKKNVHSKPLDLKGSNFRCLRGVPEEAVYKLLLDVRDKKLSLQELSSQCQSIKQLSRIQSAFVKATNCHSWEEAVQKYPEFTTVEQLEPFKKLYFMGSTLPEAFMKYCQTAITTPQAANKSASIITEDDRIFVIKHDSRLGIMWQTDAFLVNGENLDKVLKQVSFP